MNIHVQLCLVEVTKCNQCKFKPLWIKALNNCSNSLDPHCSYAGLHFFKNEILTKLHVHVKYQVTGCCLLQDS